MINEEIINYVFPGPGDSLSEFMTAQRTHKQWIEYLDNNLIGIESVKGQVISASGRIPDQIYFLKRGCVKAYYKDKDDVVHVIHLWDGLSLVTDIKNYIDQKPSDLYIEVTSDAYLALLERSALNKILSEYPESSIFLTSLAMKSLRYFKERDIDTRSLSFHSQLEKLLSTRKLIDMKFLKNDVASYLNLSRSRFSILYKRIRR